MYTWKAPCTLTAHRTLQHGLLPSCSRGNPRGAHSQTSHTAEPPPLHGARMTSKHEHQHQEMSALVPVQPEATSDIKILDADSTSAVNPWLKIRDRVAQSKSLAGVRAETERVGLDRLNFLSSVL